MLPSKSVLILLRLYILEFIIIMILIKAGNSLKCRTDDGPSDGELKRVARSCMRKFGDVAFVQNSQQQQQHQQSQVRYRQRSGNRDNYGYNYEDSEEGDDDDFEDQYYNNYNNNNNNNRNYHRQQSGSSNNNNNNNERGGNIGGHNGGGYNRSRYSGNNNNNRSNSGTGNTGYNNWNYSNQRNNMGNSPNNRGTNSNRNKNNNNNQNSNSTDAACIVHCFFEEMHMLNNNNYPDRHKMLYVLTKDLRDRELRNFYTDTIQECFRYLETQKRRDICKFSRDLITCITEYAKGNCDDWNEFSMMFN